jgi:hypothetical protein
VLLKTYREHLPPDLQRVIQILVSLRCSVSNNLINQIWPNLETFTQSNRNVQLSALQYWTGLDFSKPLEGQVKKLLELDKAGWKIFLQLPTPILRYLNVGSTVALCKHIGHVPRQSFFFAVIRFIPQSDETQPMLACLKRFSEATIGTRDVRKFIKANSNVLDYARSVHQLDTNQLKQPFSWWQQKSREWHEDVTNRRVASLGELSEEPFVSAIKTFEAGGFKATALVSKKALAVEGEEMDHCVGSYYPKCLSGVSRIFSVYAGDEHVGTAELFYTTRWTCVQLKGYHNALVSDKARRFAMTLANAYQQAHPTTHLALAPLPITSLPRTGPTVLLDIDDEFPPEEDLPF